jgi:DNA-binding MarR family transcriptional regulator
MTAPATPTDPDRRGSALGRTDVEERDDVPWLDDVEMDAWLALVNVVYRLPQALDRQLRQEMGVSHAYYSMLSTLSAQPDRALTMGELARSTHTSPSRLSHAVGTLESRGWVLRRPCPTNRRVQYATLTDAGFDVLRRMAPSHVAEVRRRVFDHLTRQQVEQLGIIASTLADALVDEAAERGSASDSPASKG